ncbi:4Fe-4S dicluster domain-containing protein [Agrilactobacillus yilanensis]|uniref:4Fe-4S dicluster domain-containing protein n=1 Tax=Agrilactobacillus yilanensis TaxID=2485997 RepID=A0ABW4J5R5_9LACO|nr:4Fe-4S dicluster domain-containing protein [Agrilactobacillus yilanensis]
MKKLAFVVEADRCIGCKGCQIACKLENHLGLGTNRTLIKEIGPTGEYPNIQMYFLPAMCQQCKNPTCVAVCPTGACHVNPEDGVILIDQEKCIGCKSCVRACPYEAISFNEERHVSDKCDLCAQSRQQGNAPACVKNCSGGALHVGDLNDPESDVSKLLADAGEANVYNLRDFGNGPAVKYILKNDDWLDILPQECVSVRRGKQK